jgi:hypothetical protein
LIVGLNITGAMAAYCISKPQVGYGACIRQGQPQTLIA